jgi:hypothetical protein
MERLINGIVTIVAAFVGAWFGAKFSAARSAKIQDAFLHEINSARNSLAAIARRLPGGEAYAAAKQAEQRGSEGHKMTTE